MSKLHIPLHVLVSHVSHFIGFVRTPLFEEELLPKHIFSNLGGNNLVVLYPSVAHLLNFR